MMPAWILRFLPHAIVIATVLGAIVWIDDNAADRTRGQIEAEGLRIEAKVRADLRATEAKLSTDIGAIGDKVTADSGKVEQLHRTVIQPTIIKEMSHEVRYTDPAAGIPDSVREQINAALTAVACTARADGGIQCALSTAAGASEQ